MEVQALTPPQIVEYLDEYIIGQTEAKKTIAIALRNRYRRFLLPKELQEEITPKNILMIGSTGVGKTEIARRMAKMLNLPFIKVEASKYTEVGFVGRDVESMIRDLLNASYSLVQKEHQEKNADQIQSYIETKIAQKLLPPLPSGVTQEKQEDYEKSFATMLQKVRNGEVDHLKIEIEISKKSDFSDFGLPPEISKAQESIVKIIAPNQSIKKEVTIKEAKDLLHSEALEHTLDQEIIKNEALKRAENGGIVFIDEIDKIAVGSKDSSRSDPSKEGVQRDLLPIVEGSNVQTKFGQIKTDHILFIAAGAFHFSKPSDLIPELQGRFPLRVELSNLTEEAMVQILTQTKNSILKQYQALLKTEEVDLVFEDEAIVELARLSISANQKTEDIGARRLHTTIEKVLEDLSFEAHTYKGQTITITADLVRKKLSHLVENVDLARYIL
ncbi:HslU--HslV peptidase ATPase subunit [Helicobacter pametensis]|uniref:HslU--HslV peptidase ATPase subunit n=1 Tax=Helicobacter pametensis TaxID=95149 RepID=UPI0004828B4F|nr:HslU--HslV peptidase ATPase subunit [Helicobacter pametensis]